MPIVVSYARFGPFADVLSQEQSCRWVFELTVIADGQAAASRHRPRCGMTTRQTLRLGIARCV